MTLDELYILDAVIEKRFTTIAEMHDKTAKARSILVREIELKTMNVRKGREDEKGTMDRDVIICRSNEGRDTTTKE